MPRSTDSDCWRNWQPRDVATILFVRRSGGAEILLIRKKRGLGAGKINGPGGRVDPGETILEAAVREVREELLIEAHAPSAAGVLRFQFLDGYSLLVFLFTSDSHSGKPQETDEAIPLWHMSHEIPFPEMWQDDELWFPYLLENRTFSGRFFFDGDEMGDHALETCTPEHLDGEIRQAEALMAAREQPPRV